jgi:cyclic di-GMP phosphodiesterase Gmr
VDVQEDIPVELCEQVCAEEPGAVDDGLLRDLVGAVEAMVCIFGADGRLLLANPALQRFTGRSAEDLLGRAFWDVFVVPEHVALAQDAVAQAMATGRGHPQEGDWLTGDGERRRVAMLTTVLTDAEGQPYALGCIARDVTEERDREAQLHHRAQTDLLTGIANRAALFESLRRRLDVHDGPACAVLFCDLDEFKDVNDEHGHAVGDRLLADVARRLVELTEPGYLVARFGGDEFVILCPHADEERLVELSRQVVARVEGPFDGPAGPLSVSVSVGMAVGRPGESADDLIGRADRAMYGVKTHHRRRAPRTD